MSKAKLHNLEVPATLVTPRDDPTALLFEPALSCSTVYKRAVGFFTSAWISRNAVGLARLASKGGVARWITSPHLTQSDWNALRQGSESAVQLLERRLTESVEELARSLSEDTLNTMAWMVADGLLEFRISIAKDDVDNRDFHSKIGIFSDDTGPQIAFVGSMNETARGANNHEIVSVFSTTRDETNRIIELDSLFDSLWNGEDPTYEIYTLPDAARSRIVQLAGPKRPYPLATHNSPKPFRSVLRPYQIDALEAWSSNSRRGILQMATGTGKTKTALACIESVFAGSDNKVLALIACPFQHLVDQWAEELEKLGVETVRAHGASVRWRPEAHRLISRLNRRSQTRGIIVTTYATLTSEHLQHILVDIEDGVFFVADECHYLGSPTSALGMNANYLYRLGLSATPVRHYDEGGTQAVLDYFDGVVYEYGMAKAISNGFLVPYRYFPEFVELTEQESVKYAELSDRISRLFVQDSADAKEQAKRLAIQRARILNNAEAKIDWLRRHLLVRPAADWFFTLVYSGDRIFERTTELIGRELRIRQHEFTSRQSRPKRKDILERFESRDLQVLSAMRCLDEGVDVPPTRNAYFLASSGNPREFIQRRGRILRPAEGKAEAIIYDAIAIPSMNLVRSNSMWNASRAALRGQLARVQEFSKLATNRVEAEAAVFDLRLQFDLPLSEGEETEYDEL